MEISDKAFHDSLIHASDTNDFDYAFFDPYYIPGDKKHLLTRLNTPMMHRSEVGDEVGIAGYPLRKHVLRGIFAM